MVVKLEPQLFFLLPPRVQNVVTRIAVEMHNSLEKQNSIH
jgi:hypothetical protein